MPKLEVNSMYSKTRNDDTSNSNAGGPMPVAGGQTQGGTAALAAAVKRVLDFHQRRLGQAREAGFRSN